MCSWSTTWTLKYITQPKQLNQNMLTDRLQYISKPLLLTQCESPGCAVLEMLSPTINTLVFVIWFEKWVCCVSRCEKWVDYSGDRTQPRGEQVCGELDLHVLFAYDAHCWENLDDLRHHAGLFGINGPGQQQQAPLVSQNPLQTILSTYEREKKWIKQVHWVSFNESICIHGELTCELKMNYAKHLLI